MKPNKIEKPRSRKALFAAVSLVFAAVVVAAVGFAYSELKSVWNEQAVVRDIASQVSVSDGKMVRGDAVLDAFGIRKGANLAEIDFDERRREILNRIPNIRTVTVSRRMPDGVDISVEERTPIVRLGVVGQQRQTGRVADSEGVVFTCRRGTGMLPVIRENQSSVTPVGGRLSGRRLAGLRLIEAASERSFASLGVLEVDVTKTDFILATLGNYAQVKIAWLGMDEQSAVSRADLDKRLTHLVKAIKSDIGSDAKMWNATESDRIYADTRETLL